MRGNCVFSNKMKVGCNVLIVGLIFILYFINDIQGKKLISHIPASKVSAFKLSGSLRFLSKAVFTKALIKGNILLATNESGLELD